MSKQPETHLILVGFTCSARPDADQYMPEFSIPANLTRQETIDKHLKQKKEDWLASLCMTPYMNSIDQVCALDTGSGDIALITADEVRQSTRVGRKKYAIPEELSLSHKLTHWLTSRYHWDSNPFKTDSVPEAIFAGFDPRVFLKSLAAQCAMETPRTELNPMPASIWYDNQDHRDVMNAMVPNEFQSKVSFQTACKRLSVSLPPDYEPHTDPIADVRIAGTIVLRLGLLLDSSWAVLVEALNRLPQLTPEKNETVAQPAPVGVA